MSVLVVGDRRHDLGADKQDVARQTALAVGAGGLQGEDEAAAGCFDVVPPGVDRADLLLDDAGGRREGHVGRDGRHEDEVHVLDGQSGVGQGGVGGQRTVVRRGRARFHQAPFANTGPFDDPIVVGLDHLFQIGVGQDPLGEAHA